MPNKPILDPAFQFSDKQLSDINLTELLAGIRLEDLTSPILHTAKYETIKRLLPNDLPSNGTSLKNTLKTLEQITFHYRRKNRHGGFYGYICSPGLPTDALAQRCAGRSEPKCYRVFIRTGRHHN